MLIGSEKSDDRVRIASISKYILYISYIRHLSEALARAVLCG